MISLVDSNIQLIRMCKKNIDADLAIVSKSTRYYRTLRTRYNNMSLYMHLKAFGIDLGTSLGVKEEDLGRGFIVDANLVQKGFYTDIVKISNDVVNIGLDMQKSFGIKLGLHSDLGVVYTDGCVVDRRITSYIEDIINKTLLYKFDDVLNTNKPEIGLFGKMLFHESGKWCLHSDKYLPLVVLSLNSNTVWNPWQYYHCDGEQFYKDVSDRNGINLLFLSWMSSPDAQWHNIKCSSNIFDCDFSFDTATITRDKSFYDLSWVRMSGLA